jgi:gliding motility-associated-like protein
VVNPVAALSSSLAPAAICSGDLFSYTATSTTAGVTMTWSRAAVAGISNPASSGTGNISETLVNSGNLPINVNYVYVLSSGGCNNTQNVVVTVNPAPKLTSSLNAPSLCSGSVFSYVPTSLTPGTTFTWNRTAVAGISNASSSGVGNPNEILVNTSALPVVVSYVYTLSSGGCTNPLTYTVNVTVNPFPTLTSNLTPPAICSGTAFSYNPTSLVTGTVFSWSRSTVGGISNASASGTGNPNEVLINTTTSPLTVTYAYSLSANGCNNSSIYNVRVVVNPAITLSSTLSPPSICTGSVFSYVPSSPTPGVAFNWNRASVAGIINPAASGVGDPIETLTNSTALPVVVTYTYTLSLGGCTKTYNVLVTVNPLPVLTSSLNPTAICSNSVFSYSPTSTTPGTVFSWSRAAVAGISNSANTGINNPNEILVNTTSSPISVSYVYSLSSNGCTNPSTFTVVVTVDPAPSLSSSLSPPAICSGSQFNYVPASTVVGAVMSWRRSAVSGIIQTATSGSGSISEFLTNSTSSPVNVTYQYTLSDNGCSNVQNVVVVVNPSPVLTSSLTPPSICSGSLFNYAATSSSIGTAFSWTRTVVPGILEPASSGTNDINETLTNTTNAPVVVTYSYSLTANGCTNNSYNVTVTVNPTPAIPMITPPGPLSFCTGGNVILSAPAGYSSYLWSNGATSQNITVTLAGSYSVMVKDGNGCQSASSAPVVTTIHAAATSNAGNDGLICAGSNFDITGASATNYSSFLWSSSGTGTFINGTTLSPTYVPSAQDQAAGVVTLTLSAYSIPPCTATVVDALMLTIRPLPVVNAGADKSVCYPASLLVVGTATNYQNPSWTHNGTGTLTGNNSLTPTYHPGAADVGNTVKLTLTVDALNPCSSTITDFMLIQVDAVPGNPGVISAPAGSRCKGTTATYSVLPIAGATNYIWSLPAGITILSGANTNIINVSIGASAVSGNITVYGSGSCGNGAVSTIPVVVADVPANPGSISGKSIVCQGSTGEIFTVTPVTGATSYTWTVPSGAIITSVPPLTNSITVDFGLSSMDGNVTVFASNSCGAGPLATKAIKVNSKPTTPVITPSGGPTTFCEGGSLLLSGPTIGYNYLWSPGGAITQTIIVTTSGNYSVVVTDPATGCSATSNSINVLVNQAPAPPASIGFITQCLSGGPIPHLDASTVTSTAAGTTIFWYDAAVGGNVVASPTLNTIGTVTYYAESRDNVTGCLSLTRTSVKLTISNNPATPVAGPSLIACEQSPVQVLTATASSAAGTTLLWYTTPSSGIPVSPTLSTVGTKTFYAEASNGTCVSTARSAGVVLTINPAPSAPVSGGDITECINMPAAQTLTASAAAPAGSSVRWWSAPSGGTMVIPPALPTLFSLGTKTYYAESINTLTGCTSLSRTPVTLSLVLHPVAPVPDPDIVECEKSPLQTLTATAKVSTGFSIKWYTTASGGALVNTPTLHAVGSVTYYAEADNGLCQSLTRVPVTLTINPAPSTPVSLGDITDCEKSPVQTLIARSSDPAALWYTTPTGGSPVNPFLSAVGSATYYAESMLGTCPSLARSAGVVLTIKAIPEPPVSQGDQRACEQNPMQTLTAIATPPPGSTVKWYLTPTGGVPISNPTINSVKAITYYAESDNGSCKSLTRTAVSLQIDAAPKAPVAGLSITECESVPNIQRLTATASAGGSTITWYATPSGGEQVSPILEQVGTATYYAEANNGSCNSVVRSAPVVLTINPTPAAPVTINQKECPTKPLQVLTATTELPASGVTISWYNSLTGGTPVASPILKVVGSKIYFAESKLGKCVNPNRTGDTLIINSIIPDPILKTKGMDSIVTCESKPVMPLYAKDLFTPVAGQTIVCYDAATGGFEVPPKLDIAGSATMYAAAKDTITGCVSFGRVKVKLVIHAAPPAPVSSGDISECSLNPVQTLDANKSIVTIPEANVVWYDSATGGSVVTPTLTKSTTQKDTTTTYYAENVDKLTKCVSLTRTAVKLSLISTTASAASNSPVAMGQTLLLRGGPELPGNTYLWKDPGGFIFTTIDVTITNVTASAAGWYHLSVTSLNGCVATDSVNVMMDIARAEAQTPVCIGATLYLSGYPANMKSYAWSGPNGFSSSEQNPSINKVTTSNAGTYTLTVTNSNNATSTDTVSVSFKALPIPIADYSTVCPAGTMQLKAGPNGMTSYLWTGQNGSTWPQQNPPAMAFPNPAERFTLTVVDWNGCEASKTITPVQFQPRATSNSPICAGDTLRLRGEPNGMVSYRWSGPNGFLSSLQSPTINNVNSGNAAGDYTLTVIDQAGCTFSTKVAVTFNPAAPVPTISPNINPICAGSILVLNGGPYGMSRYDWTGPNGFTSRLQSPQILNMDQTNAGKYTLNITNPTGCKNSADIIIGVNSATMSGTYGPYCLSDLPVSITVTPQGGIFSGPGIVGNTFDPKLAGVGSHTIQYTYSLGGGACSIINYKIIEVVSVPKVVTNNLVLQSCSGTTADLTDPNVTAGSTPGLIFSYYTDSKATVPIPIPKFVAAGTYFIKGSTPSGKCSDIQPVMVGQPDSLRANITALSVLNCAHDTTGSLSVNITMGTPPFSYRWSTVPVQTTATASNLRSGIYTVVVTDAKMCTAAFTGEIVEPAPIKLGFNTKPIQCLTDANGTARVDTINGSTDVNLLNSYKYQWATNPVQLTREAVRLTANWHKLSLISAKGCVQKDSVFIDVLDVTPPSIVCPKDIDLIVPYIKSPDGSPNKYVVDLGKALTFDNCTVDTIWNDAPAKFRTGLTYVVWTVRDQVGLMDTCTQRIYIKEIPTIPQLISPNGDGVNDKFVIDGLNSLDYQNSQMLIFTRSGQLVFQSNNYELPENAWNGRFSESSFAKNSLVAPGVYYYILKLGGSSNQTMKGYIYVYY